MTDATTIKNFNFGFSSHKSDILLHLSQWQYWWWFWFSLFWTLYLFIIVRLVAKRNEHFNPVINTSLRGHGKWGDFVVALIPLSWCGNILVNSNFILRMIEWQNESSLFTLRVQARQWYWVYKFDNSASQSIRSAPKNIGHNRWAVFMPHESYCADTYFQALHMGTELENKRAYLQAGYEKWGPYFVTGYEDADKEKITEQSLEGEVSVLLSPKTDTLELTAENAIRSLHRVFYVNSSEVFKGWSWKNYIKASNIDQNLKYIFKLTDWTLWRPECLTKEQKFVYYNNHYNQLGNPNSRQFNNVAEFAWYMQNHRALRGFYKNRRDDMELNFNMEAWYDAFFNFSEEDKESIRHWLVKEEYFFPGPNNADQQRHGRRLLRTNIEDYRDAQLWFFHDRLNTLYDFDGRNEHLKILEKTFAVKSPDQTSNVDSTKHIIERFQKPATSYNNTITPLAATAKDAYLNDKYNKIKNIPVDVKVPEWKATVNSSEDTDVEPESMNDTLRALTQTHLKPLRFIKGVLNTHNLDILTASRTLKPLTEEELPNKPLLFVVKCAPVGAPFEPRGLEMEHEHYWGFRQRRPKRIRKYIYPVIPDGERNLFKTLPVSKEAYANQSDLTDKYKKVIKGRVIEGRQPLREDVFKYTKALKFNRHRHELVPVNLARRLLRTKRTLVLPAHVNITVVTSSYDVVHSWFIPGLGIKLDCVPGRSTHHTFYVDNIGFYYGQCAEICGRFHHHMPIRICALSFEHFLAWWVKRGARRIHRVGELRFIIEKDSKGNDVRVYKDMDANQIARRYKW